MHLFGFAIVTLLMSLTLGAQDKPPLDGEEVNLYMETCLPKNGHVTLKQLYEESSSTCLPPRPNMRCSSPVNGFAIDSVSGRCQAVTDSCDTDRVFPTNVECQYMCEKQCTQPRDNGVEDCDEEPDTAYYFHSTSKQCRSFTYTGCGGNKNRFESAVECQQVCGSGSVVRTSPARVATRIEARASSSVAERQKRAVLAARTVVPSRSVATSFASAQANATFCKQFDETYPQVKTIMNNLQGEATSKSKKFFFSSRTTNDNSDVGDLYALVTPPEGSEVEGEERTRRQLNLGGLIPRRLKWATVIRRKNCRRFDVTVRLFCIGAVFKGPPSSAERKRLCGLIRRGIERYWSRSITYKGQTWEMRVKAKESFLLSKKIIIKYYPEDKGNTRSHNSDIWPMTMKYRAFRADADADFMRVAAHETGHSNLMNWKGLVWSWGHKGSSTIFGKTKNSAPVYPSSGEIDLMIYHNGNRPSDFYDRVKLGEEDAHALIRGATFYFPLPWCPGTIGAACSRDSQCDSGHCHGFRCVECESNSHCSSGQYCFGVNIPLVVNKCRSKKSRGELCTRDSMCKSGRCSGLRCVDCESDSHCSSSTYCWGLGKPLVINTCKARRNNGAVCSRDRQCKSSRCHGLRCSECETDAHCGSSKYCKNKNVPLVANKCEYKRNNGAVCSRDGMCKSSHCDGARCGECEYDSHCGSGKFCRYKNVPLVANKCEYKRNNGAVCSRDSMCKSTHCDGGRCAECEVDSHCGSGKFCKNNNIPLVVNKCEWKKNNGAVCAQDRQCKSGRCHGLRCGECEVDSHCGSGKYCKNKNKPLITNTCAYKVCKGWCSRSSMCKSGKCIMPFFRCKKC